MFSGSMTALITPMNTDGSLDKPAFERLVQWQLAEGADALLVLGTTGESVTLTSDEREYLVKTTVRLVSGRCPVVVGAGNNNTAASIASCQEAYAWGADALLVVTPYYNKPTQKGLIAHYTALAEATPAPIILYNVPHRTGCDLLPESVIELSKLPSIVAVKEATGDLDRVTKILRAAPGFVVLSGDDATAAQAVLLGAKGVVSVASNIIPKLMHELMLAALGADLDLVETLQARLKPIFDACAVQSNPIPLKWMMSEAGFISEGIRLPLMPLESVYHAPLRDVMTQLELLHKEA